MVSPRQTDTISSAGSDATRVRATQEMAANVIMSTSAVRWPARSVSCPEMA